MLARKIKQAIASSRRAARNFRQALENLGDELAANDPRRQPVPIPIPIPARSRSPFPFPARTGMPDQPVSPWTSICSRLAPVISRVLFPRAFRWPASTLFPLAVISKLAKIPRVEIARSFHQASYPRAMPPKGISRTVQAVLCNVQPFRSAVRPRFAGCPNALYANFTRHNARMFSTFGPNVTAQAVQNISQGVRAFFIKTAQSSLGKNLSTGSHVGSCSTNSNTVQKLFAMTNRDPSCIRNLGLDGCFVEFSLAPGASGASADILPGQCILDDDVVKDLTSFVKYNVEYQKLVLKEIVAVQHKIGSPLVRRVFGHRGEALLRLYFPDCSMRKMEMLLTDAGITTGMVHRLPAAAPGVVPGRAVHILSSSVDSSPGVHTYDSIISTSTESGQCLESESYYDLGSDILSSGMSDPEYFMAVQ